MKKETLLITGISGALGKALCKFYRDRYRITGIHRDEHKTINVPDYAEAELASVRDYDRVDQAFARFKPDYVIHAASLKKIDDIERFPMEGVLTNVMGTNNVCRAASKYGVKKLVFTGTDKQINSLSIYGSTKFIANGLVQSWNNYSDTVFSSLSYGNILGSTSSVLPKFIRLIKAGKKVPLTHEQASRFFFTIMDSVELIDKVLTYGVGYDRFVPIMDGFYVRDLVKAVSIYLDMPYEYEVIGWRGVEKETEELLTEEEMDRTYCVDDTTLVVLPRDMNKPYYTKELYTGKRLTAFNFLNTNVEDLVKLIERSIE